MLDLSHHSAGGSRGFEGFVRHRCIRNSSIFNTWDSANLALRHSKAAKHPKTYPETYDWLINCRLFHAVLLLREEVHVTPKRIHQHSYSDEL